MEHRDDVVRCRVIDPLLVSQIQTIRLPEHDPQRNDEREGDDVRGGQRWERPMAERHLGGHIRREHRTAVTDHE